MPKNDKSGNSHKKLKSSNEIKPVSTGERKRKRPKKKRKLTKRDDDRIIAQHILELPKESTWPILQHLSLKDLAIMRQTCSAYRDIINNPEFLAFRFGTVGKLPKNFQRDPLQYISKKISEERARARIDYSTILPTEMLVAIFEFFHPTELLPMMLINKTHHAIITSPLIFKNRIPIMIKKLNADLEKLAEKTSTLAQARNSKKPSPQIIQEVRKLFLAASFISRLQSQANPQLDLNSDEETISLEHIKNIKTNLHNIDADSCCVSSKVFPYSINIMLTALIGFSNIIAGVAVMPYSLRRVHKRRHRGHGYDVPCDQYVIHDPKCEQLVDDFKDDTITATILIAVGFAALAYFAILIVNTIHECNPSLFRIPATTKEELRRNIVSSVYDTITKASNFILPLISIVFLLLYFMNRHQFDLDEIDDLSTLRDNLHTSQNIELMTLMPAATTAAYPILNALGNLNFLIFSPVQTYRNGRQSLIRAFQSCNGYIQNTPSALTRAGRNNRTIQTLGSHIQSTQTTLAGYWRRHSLFGSQANEESTVTTNSRLSEQHSSDEYSSDEEEIQIASPSNTSINHIEFPTDRQTTNSDSQRENGWSNILPFSRLWRSSPTNSTSSNNPQQNENTPLLLSISGDDDGARDLENGSNNATSNYYGSGL